MKRMKKEEKLECFLEAVGQAFSQRDERSYWPASATQIEPYFSDIFAVSLFEKYQKSKERFRQGLKLLNAAVLRNALCHNVIIGLKVAKKYGYPITTQELTDYVNVFFDVIGQKIKNDPFSLDNQFRLLTPKEVNSLCQTLTFVTVNDLKTAKAIAGLGVTLESFIWSLWFDIFREGGELFHGSYPTGRGTLLIKDFFNLHSEVWQNECQYTSVSLYLLYDHNVSLWADLFDRLTFDQPVWDKLNSFAIILNQKTVIKNPKEVDLLDSYFSQQRLLQTRTIKTLRPVEIVRKGIQIHYCLFRKFFEFYKQGWNPPEKIEARIRQRGLKYWERGQIPAKRPREYYQKLFDPRLDFVG